MSDKILDFDSQEGDTISGECKFDDKSVLKVIQKTRASIIP